MAKKPKKPLTAAQRADRKRRKAEFMTVFINGGKKRVRRPPMIEGLPADEFIRRNADPIWLHQHGYCPILAPHSPLCKQEENDPRGQRRFSSLISGPIEPTSARGEQVIDLVQGLKQR